MQKLVKASNLEKALKQTAKYKGLNLPKTIDWSNKDGYVVAFVTSTPNFEKRDFDAKANIQVMNKLQFEISIKSKLVEGEVVVLHDPTIAPKTGFKPLTLKQIAELNGEKFEDAEEQKEEK